ncbi:pentapeptide repeat-containing protein [Mucilaginibacter sp. SP1R1]|uniref:pentapeptide repeat-containing protein n=1 Tax=Mucilaginibacter sp. SP1R1 TaxID=2723091 RepID=UPI001617D568|nr:pentapeptide repeat-containing protein [Mucilaginibacter sp. SP1R1]MBB6148794.1 uncharacterized protein YjbI with pentapeptide repeats [Mucilaginibacter sp. SP1R1]
MSTFNSNTADFAGKWSFSTPDNSLLISLSSVSPGTALVAATGDHYKPAANQQFNLYGDVKSGFVLQAPNWLYIYFNNGYQATKSRGDAACSVFAVQTAGPGTVCIVETSGGADYYVVVDSSNNLNRIIKQGTAPANAQFNQNKVTDGIADIRKQKSTLANPLTGVYLAGQDLTNIAFMATDVSYANLAHTRLDNTSNFNGATASSTIFDQANMQNWVANGLVFKNCSFVNANMSFVKMASSKLVSCTLNKVNFANAILQDADFTSASMVNSSFYNAKVNGATFKSAILINADLSGAIGVEAIISIESAILIAADVSGHDLTKVLINEDTNFMNATLDNCNFTGRNLTNVVFARASMQKVKLDRAILNGAQMAFADLFSASVTGAVSMIGANLSNANLAGAQFPGAQLGAKQILFQLPLSDGAILDKSQIPADLKVDLKLSDQATVSVIQPGLMWQVTDISKVYQVNNTGTNLLVQVVSATSNAAILSNAYMFQTNFQQANLYAVEMSGVHWYGSGASALSADLGIANLSNSFLANMNFEQSLMQGASLDYATLIGTIFDGANLNPTESMKPTSFAFASMQSTSFNGASNLNYANLTNAAISLKNGVPLFTIASTFSTTLNSGIVSALLLATFNDMAYSLINTAKITVLIKGSNWTIRNMDALDATQTGYGTFYLELINQENGMVFIQVYGASPLLILNSDGKGGQIQIPLSFGPSAITRKQMNDSTTCPSGMKLYYLSDYLSYEELMTPALPPKPPTCLDCWG